VLVGPTTNGDSLYMLTGAAVRVARSGSRSLNLVAVLLAAGAVLGATTLSATSSPLAASSAHSVSRQSRTSGIAIAGGDIFVWSVHRSVRTGAGCTLSFAVRSDVTHRAGSLTAGHCVGTLSGPPVYTVNQTRNGAGNTTNPGDQLGVVSAGAYRLGKNGDSAFISLIPFRQARPAVFTGGRSSRATIPVAGLARLRDGIHVCYSGAVSGEHCGFTVVGRPETTVFHEGHHTYRIHHEWRARAQTCTSRAGDSGSPVYVKRADRAFAVGILSGGQRRLGSCPFFFTPVQVALSQLHLRLLRAQGS
jgi:hypothetical protein